MGEISVEPVVQGTLPAWAKGSGYGYGYGSGDGSGYGSGDGSGYGYGYGYGYGSGDGSGYGYGYGSGDGSGSGYGYGYGSGDGSGYGSGYGLKEAAFGFLSMLPNDRRKHAEKLLAAGAKLAYWKSDKDGRAANGGKSDPVHIGLVQTVPGPLRLCQPGTLHATYRLDKWTGERIWLVALSGEVKEDDDKLGALKREFIAELTGGKIQ